MNQTDQYIKQGNKKIIKIKKNTKKGESAFTKEFTEFIWEKTKKMPINAISRKYGINRNAIIKIRKEHEQRMG